MAMIDTLHERDDESISSLSSGSDHGKKKKMK